MNKAIFHYHLFKNAGTSLDASLKENFTGDKWVTAEFPAQPVKNRELASQWVADNPQASCFSSHTALFPPPKVEGRIILPIIFVRHPIDRIASAYSFEKKQGDDGFGSVLARNTSFKGYCETRLALKYDRQCRNFHVERFASMFGVQFGSEIERAMKALEALPFVGLVEEFDKSLQRLENWLKTEGFDDIAIVPKQHNVSRDNKRSLEEKLSLLEDELGPDVYKKLVAENESDFKLYEKVKANYLD